MDWASLIAMLIKDLYPVLVDAFKRWLDNLIPKAQRRLEARGKTKGTRAELLTECLAIAPRLAVFKRLALRRMIAVEGKPNANDKAELTALMGVIKRDQA